MPTFHPEAAMVVVCRFCRHEGEPVVRFRIPFVCWLTFIAVSVTVCGLLWSWYCLLIWEEVRSCAACGRRLN